MKRTILASTHKGKILTRKVQGRFGSCDDPRRNSWLCRALFEIEVFSYNSLFGPYMRPYLPENCCKKVKIVNQSEEYLNQTTVMVLRYFQVKLWIFTFESLLSSYFVILLFQRWCKIFKRQVNSYSWYINESILKSVLHLLILLLLIHPIISRNRLHERYL